MSPLRRRLNQAGGVLLMVLLVLVALVVLYRAFVAPSYPDTGNVAHAGGAIDGAVYTNAIAAMERSAAQGFTLIEVDFQRTADGVLVCGHDWDAYPDGPPDLEAFLADRGTHPACTIDELVGWMATEPATLLVSDAKEDVLGVNAELRARVGDRLIPQAYDAAEARQLLEAGSPAVILTVYRLDGILAAMREIDAVAALGDRVRAITVPGNLALAGLALWAKFRTGLPVYAHTINDCGLAGLLGFFGVDAIYSDILAPSAC